MVGGEGQLLYSVGGEEGPDETCSVFSNYACAVHSQLTLPFDHMLVSMMMMNQDFTRQLHWGRQKWKIIKDVKEDIALAGNRTRTSRVSTTEPPVLFM